jgi:hypothetical protein
MRVIMVGLILAATSSCGHRPTAQERLTAVLVSYQAVREATLRDVEYGEFVVLRDAFGDRVLLAVHHENSNEEDRLVDGFSSALEAFNDSVLLLDLPRFGGHLR